MQRVPFAPIPYTLKSHLPNSGEHPTASTSAHMTIMQHPVAADASFRLYRQDYVEAEADRESCWHQLGPAVDSFSVELLPQTCLPVPRTKSQAITSPTTHILVSSVSALTLTPCISTPSPRPRALLLAFYHPQEKTQPAEYTKGQPPPLASFLEQSYAEVHTPTCKHANRRGWSAVQQANAGRRSRMCDQVEAAHSLG